MSFYRGLRHHLAPLWLLGLAAVCAWGGCYRLFLSEKDRIVEFVLPDGFRGLCCVVAQDGAPAPTVVTSWTDIRYVVRVPSDGVVVVPSTGEAVGAPFRLVHFQNGAELQPMLIPDTSEVAFEDATGVEFVLFLRDWTADDGACVTGFAVCTVDERAQWDRTWKSGEPQARALELARTRDRSGIVRRR